MRNIENALGEIVFESNCFPQKQALEGQHSPKHIRRITRIFDDQGEPYWTWDFYNIGDSVSIIALTPQNEIIALYEYFLAPNCKLLHTITGEIRYSKTGQKEDFLACAIREITEKTGYAASDFIYLGRTFLSPQHSLDVCHLLLALNCVKTCGEPWQPPSINTPKEFDQLIADGTIIDFPSLAVWAKARMFVMSRPQQKKAKKLSAPK